jgi:hypothetical protein
VTPTEALASHRQFLLEDGEPILIRRYSGIGGARTKVEAQVQARAVGFRMDELVGGVTQGDRSIIALNDPDAAVPQGMVTLASLLPITTNDKVVVRGKELAIIAPDDSTRRVGGVLIALQLQVRG